MESDLALGAPFIKGQVYHINNCWHFYTNGDDIDFLFKDENDFKNGMNRLYIVSSKFNIIILAFCLMDTHVHFVLYGEFDECNKFTHEYIRLTSMDISHKYNERNKMKNVIIGYQIVDNDDYLKTVICYVLKNPISAGLHYMPWDYPWSSGALYFRNQSIWTVPLFLFKEFPERQFVSGREMKKLLKTNDPLINNELKLINGIVYPNEYVAVEICERCFRTPKSYFYYLGKNRNSDVESKGGIYSSLSIPYQELRQHRKELCKELFGTDSVRQLSVQQRIHLAKKMKFKYNSSPKQLARICCLVYDEVKNLLQ